MEEIYNERMSPAHVDIVECEKTGKKMVRKTIDKTKLFG